VRLGEPELGFEKIVVVYFGLAGLHNKSAHFVELGLGLGLGQGQGQGQEQAHRQEVHVFMYLHGVGQAQVGECYSS
jgi:hypothetical protein